MSGGHFDYQQYRIGQIADDIQILIDTNDDRNADGWDGNPGRGYPPDVIERFREAVKILRIGQVYAQRIDWLVSGDDGEKGFLERLEEELNGLR